MRSGVNWTRLVPTSSEAARAAHEEGLGDAGHPLEEDVAAAQQRDEQPRDGGVLADDGLGDLVADPDERGRAASSAGSAAPWWGCWCSRSWRAAFSSRWASCWARPTRPCSSVGAGPRSRRSTSAAGRPEAAAPPATRARRRRRRAGRGAVRAGRSGGPAQDAGRRARGRRRRGTARRGSRWSRPPGRRRAAAPGRAARAAGPRARAKATNARARTHQGRDRSTRARPSARCATGSPSSPRPPGGTRRGAASPRAGAP